MFGGFGGGRSSIRTIRIGLLVVFLIFALTLHGHGAAYNDFHVVYLVLVIGLIALSIALSRRGSGGPGRNGGGGRYGGGRYNDQADGSVGSGSFGTPPPPPAPHPVEQPDPEAGP